MELVQIMQLKRKLSHFNLMIYVAWQVSKRLLRDKRTLGLVLLGPIFYVFIFGYGFAGEIKHQPIEIINLDQKATRTIPFVNRKLELDIGTQLVNELKNDDRVSIKNVYTQENWTSTMFENAKQKVLDKKIKAVILIPENYSKEILNSIIYQENVTEAVILYLDNSNPQVGSIILQAFREAFQKALGQFQESLNFSIEYGYGENLTQLEYFSPIVIALGTFVFSLILALVNIIEERRSGTLDLLLQSPHDKSQIIFGYMVPFAVVASLQTIVIITVSALLFDVNYGSQLPSLFVAAILMSFRRLVWVFFFLRLLKQSFKQYSSFL